MESIWPLVTWPKSSEITSPTLKSSTASSTRPDPTLKPLILLTGLLPAWWRKNGTSYNFAQSLFLWTQALYSVSIILYEPGRHRSVKKLNASKINQFTEALFSKEMSSNNDNVVYSILRNSLPRGRGTGNRGGGGDERKLSTSDTLVVFFFCRHVYEINVPSIVVCQ